MELHTSNANLGKAGIQNSYLLVGWYPFTNQMDVAGAKEGTCGTHLL